MLRHVAEPFDAGRLHGGVGVEAFGDGVGDDGLPFFFQQFHQPPLLRHQPIDLRRLPVEEGGDGGLFLEWRRGHCHSSNGLPACAGHLCPERRAVHDVDEAGI